MSRFTLYNLSGRSDISVYFEPLPETDGIASQIGHAWCVFPTFGAVFTLLSVTSLYLSLKYRNRFCRRINTLIVLSSLGPSCCIMGIYLIMDPYAMKGCLPAFVVNITEQCTEPVTIIAFIALQNDLIGLASITVKWNKVQSACRLLCLMALFSISVITGELVYTYIAPSNIVRLLSKISVIILSLYTCICFLCAGFKTAVYLDAMKSSSKVFDHDASESYVKYDSDSIASGKKARQKPRVYRNANTYNHQTMNCLLLDSSKESLCTRYRCVNDASIDCHSNVKESDNLLRDGDVRCSESEPGVGRNNLKEHSTVTRHHAMYPVAALCVIETEAAIHTVDSPTIPTDSVTDTTIGIPDDRENPDEIVSHLNDTSNIQCRRENMVAYQVDHDVLNPANDRRCMLSIRNSNLNRAGNKLLMQCDDSLDTINSASECRTEEANATCSSVEMAIGNDTAAAQTDFKTGFADKNTIDNIGSKTSIKQPDNGNIFINDISVDTATQSIGFSNEITVERSTHITQCDNKDNITNEITLGSNTALDHLDYQRCFNGTLTVNSEAASGQYDSELCFSNIGIVDNDTTIEHIEDEYNLTDENTHKKCACDILELRNLDQTSDITDEYIHLLGNQACKEHDCDCTGIYQTDAKGAGSFQTLSMCAGSFRTKSMCTGLYRTQSINNYDTLSTIENGYLADGETITIDTVSSSPSNPNSDRGDNSSGGESTNRRTCSRTLMLIKSPSSSYSLIRLRQCVVLKKVVSVGYFITFGYIVDTIFQMYSLFGVYGIFGSGRTPDPWPWFLFHVLHRAVSITICLLLLIAVFFLLNNRTKRRNPARSRGSILDTRL